MRFTRQLTPADMPELLEPDFPARLRALFDMPAPLPARVAAADYAPVTGGRGYDQQPLELRPWLAVLIAALLLAGTLVRDAAQPGSEPVSADALFSAWLGPAQRRGLCNDVLIAMPIILAPALLAGRASGA